jgi:transposase InsO family protein
MSKAGYPYDNAPMERYYNTFKSNFYYQIALNSLKRWMKQLINIIIIKRPWKQDQNKIIFGTKYSEKT